MTLIKSLKYPPNQEGRETIRKHRVHRSKKNRTVVYGRKLLLDFKRKKEELEWEDWGEVNVK
jgi:hypothetical protein